MKLIHHVEDKRLILHLGAVSVVALVAVLILTCEVTVYTNHTIRDTYARIITAVSQRYPQAEAEVVRELQASGETSSAQGYQILNRYGLSDMGVNQTGLTVALLGQILPMGLIFTGLLCAVFVFLLVRYQQAVTSQIDGISEYLKRLEVGDYSLDIRDNGEGSLSLLKNDLYKITIRLREQAEGLQSDKVYLSNALADISHQIKTPLTSALVLTDILAGDPSEDDRRQFVEQLHSQLVRIQWLVVSLLKLARLDAGTVTMKCEPVNLFELVERAIDPLRIRLEVHKQQLETCGDERAGFNGDFNWSVEALTNIVKNCAEHTSDGGRIEIAFGENALYSEISISDNGEGIPRRDLPHIFERFYRGQNADDNRIGIGLALAKAIIEAQGGDISVWSEVGVGTRFTMRIYRGIM